MDDKTTFYNEGLNLTKEDIEKAIKLVDEILKQRDEQIKQFIRDNGFDPDNGDMLVLPKSYRKYGYIQHENVAYNSGLEQPLIIAKPNLFDVMLKSKHSVIIDNLNPTEGLT